MRAVANGTSCQARRCPSVASLCSRVARISPCQAPGKTNDVPCRASDVPMMASDVPTTAIDTPCTVSDGPPSPWSVPLHACTSPDRASDAPARAWDVPPWRSDMPGRAKARCPWRSWHGQSTVILPRGPSPAHGANHHGASGILGYPEWRVSRCERGAVRPRRGDVRRPAALVRGVVQRRPRRASLIHGASPSLGVRAAFSGRGERLRRCARTHAASASAARRDSRRTSRRPARRRSRRSSRRCARHRRW